MRYVTVDDVDDLVRGAMMLGSGGGGDWYPTRQMLLHAVHRFGPVPLVKPGELDPAAPVLPVLSAGTPSALAELVLGEHESAHLRELVERFVWPGERCAAVLPIQPGPVNAVVPLVVAAQLGLPCLDADLMHRCFPAIEMTLFGLAGLRPSPLIAVDAHGTSAVLEAEADGTVSSMLRSCMPHLGLVALVSTYRATSADCARAAAVGGLSRCLAIGRALRADAPPARALAEFGAVALFNGVVTELLHRTTGGFPRGVLTVEDWDDPARVLRIDFQNENLVATEDGVVLVTVPDLISLVDVDTGRISQTVDVVVGQHLDVVGLPVGERWHAPDGIALTGPRAFGLDTDPVRLPFEGRVPG